jgi:signal transduction histidine kinase
MMTSDQDPADPRPVTKPATGSAITARLFRAAFVLYVLAAAVITCGLVAETFLTARGDLERELSIHRRTLEGTLAGPLRSFDLDDVSRISASMVDLPEIDGVRVLDHNRARDLVRVGTVPVQAEDAASVAGPAVATQSNPRTEPPSQGFGQPITVSFFVYHSHAAGRDPVGFVEIYANPLVVLERIRWRIALLVLAAVVNTAILWVIFERVGRSILVRPLGVLTDAARRTGFERLETVEFDPKTAEAARGTEIEILRVAFNDMVGDIRRSRDALAALNADLEHRVGERTRELESRSSQAAAAIARVEQSRRQVAAALDEAERAARAKSEFLALVSHELRTPLNSVLGFSELIERQTREMPETLDASQLAGYAGAIHESGTQLLTLINDILDLSRIEAGRMEVAPEWIDTAATTRTVVELMRDPATKRRVSLESALDPATPMLKVDPRRYRQMLMNLLSNALKYTEPGGEVRVLAERRADGWVEVVISDTGVGMPERDIAQALEPFSRGGDQTTRRFSGAGLGLPLVARMMQLHGGRLALESTVGAGTRAILRFPPNSVRTS